MRRRTGLVVVLVGLVGLVGLVPGTAAAEVPAWAWPLSGPHEVSRPFSPPATRYGAGHRGADLPGEPGSVVRAAGAGRVSYAGRLAGRGVVVIVHGDLRTTYEPVTTSVTVGASVAAGAEIGRLDAAHLGCPVAACLHWGLRRGEDYLDPVRLVDRGPARLLPLGGAAAAGPVPAPLDGSAGSGPVRERLGVAAGPVPAPLAANARSDGPTAAPATGAPPAPAEHEPVPAGPELPAIGGSGSPAGDHRTTAGAGGWSLRAAQAPLGIAALAALVAGIGLRARPRPGPDDPTSGAGAGSGLGEEAGPDALVLQLDVERLRRRAG